MKKISIDDLCAGMISNQTISTDHGMILVAKGICLTDSIIKRLRKFNIDVIAIQDENDEEIPIVSASTETAKKAISAVINLNDNIFNYKTVDIKDNFGKIEIIIHSVLKRPFIQKFLAGCDTNELLYKHSLRTAIVSINMGLIQKWNILNLEYLAMCAILHDFGMGREFKEADTEHPFIGFIKLREDPDIDTLIAVVCLQHHEYYNGSGFPFAFRRTQITNYACLLSIVDYYDRLLMRDSDPRKAMFETISKKNILFDPSMIEVFSATIDWSRLYNIPANISD
jgi:HD-GYP domain-containing protein (c-di-GMP phosphodiesterase class II)